MSGGRRRIIVPVHLGQNTRKILAGHGQTSKIRIGRSFVIDLCMTFRMTRVDHQFDSGCLNELQNVVRAHIKSLRKLRHSARDNSPVHIERTVLSLIRRHLLPNGHGSLLQRVGTKIHVSVPHRRRLVSGGLSRDPCFRRHEGSPVAAPLGIDCRCIASPQDTESVSEAASILRFSAAQTSSFDRGNFRSQMSSVIR